MSAKERLRRKKNLLEKINRDLKHVRPKRVRRRGRDAEQNRDSTRQQRRDLLKRQEETLDQLDHFEELLERLQDEDPDNDPDRTEKYLVAEIDLLEREREARAARVDRVRGRQRRQTRRVRRLDEKLRRHRARQIRLHQRKRRTLNRIEEIQKQIANSKPSWPSSLVVAELLYHLNHLHIATPEREKLVALARIMVAIGIRVGEFPGFGDTVECVHTTISWHYRDSSAPYVGRTCANKGNGLAIDANDVDGGSDKEVAFYHELSRRY